MFVSVKYPNEDTIYAIINKDLTSVTMEQLKERLAVLLGKEKLLNKPHGGGGGGVRILILRCKRMATRPLKHPSHRLNCQ